MSKYAEGSYRELLLIAYPLILSTASATIMQFINRLFLAHYSPETLAACVPGGMLSFTFLCFFIGIANYTNAFVSQYFGKGRPARISVAVWQGVWLSLIAWVILLLLLPLGIFIISHSGHETAVQILEKEYFLILTVPGIITILNAVLAAFFTGRGKTKVTMAVNMGGNLICTILCYFLIFGWKFIPAMGIRGAGYASVIGQLFMTLAFVKLMMTKENKKKYRTNKLAGFNKDLFMRMVKYGTPNGVGFFLEMASFMAFVFIIGGLDTASLAASNILASINTISFMPVIGLGMSALTLAGKYIGMKRPDMVANIAYKGISLAMGYAVILGFFFFFFPQVFVNIFGSGDSEVYARILELARHLMKVLAFFILFDGAGMVLSDVLRGVGDTKFQMCVASILAVFIFLPGVWYCINVGGDVIAAWGWGAFYVFFLFMVYLTRFQAGDWRKIDILKN